MMVWERRNSQSGRSTVSAAKSRPQVSRAPTSAAPIARKCSANRHLVMLIASVESVSSTTSVSTGYCSSMLLSLGWEFRALTALPCHSAYDSRNRPTHDGVGALLAELALKCSHDRDDGAGLDLNGLQRSGFLSHRCLRSWTATTHLFVLPKVRRPGVTDPTAEATRPTSMSPRTPRSHRQRSPSASVTAGAAGVKTRRARR